MKYLVFVLGIAFTQQLKAQVQFYPAVGLGPQYSGVGVNVGFGTEHEKVHIGFGCSGYSSMHGRQCGKNFSVLTSRPFNSKNHSLGISYFEKENTGSPYGASTQKYPGILYNYFWQGIHKSSWITGLSISRNEEPFGQYDYELLINIGYQF